MTPSADRFARNSGLVRGAAALLVGALLVAGCAQNTQSPASSGSPSVSSASPASVASPALVDHTPPTGATAPVDAATWALADRLASPTYTSDTTAAMVTGLARSGIAVYSDPSATAPEVPVIGAASPLQMLDMQAHSLAVGAWADSTYSGSELDSVVPLPDGETGMAPASALLAGYVAAADSPGGALSRALMAGQDLLQPSTLQFPAVVLVLFASDVATDGGRLTAPGSSPGSVPSGTPAAFAPVRLMDFTGGDAAGAAYPAVAIDTICSDSANWVNGMLDSFFGALKLATPTNLPGIIVTSIWNWMVDKLQAAVQGLISSVTDAVLGTVRSIAGMVAGVAEQIASLVPYAVKVTASQTGGTGGATFVLQQTAALSGIFTATVSAGDLPAWPAVLQDCASTAQIALPNFQAHDVPLTWGPIQAPADPLLSPLDSAKTNDTTDAKGQASWPFQTSHDPGDPTGEQLNQLDYMPVAVHRPEIDQARSRLTTALLGFIPGLLRPFVSALFAPYLDGLQSRLNTLLDARGTGVAMLVYHDKAKPTPAPSTSPAPSGACSPSPVPAGSYSGTFTLSSTTVLGTGVNPRADVTTDKGAGPFDMTVSSDGSLTGTFSYQVNEDAVIDDGAVQDEQVSSYTVSGSTVGGTACNMV
ncbi:MAG: hypothetical protein ACHQ01_10075, partial [Candidatus Limnocylindrales bacterium]